MAAGQMQVINNYGEIENSAAYATASTTAVATGDNITLIPLTSTVLKVSGIVNIFSDTATDGVTAEITYAQSSTAIAAGTAVSGTVVAATVVTHTQNVASNPNYVAITALIKGLTIGLPYTFSLNVLAITGGNGSAAIMQLMVEDY